MVTLCQVRLDVINTQLNSRTPRLETTSPQSKAWQLLMFVFESSHSYSCELIIRVAPASALGAGIHIATWCLSRSHQRGLNVRYCISHGMTLGQSVHVGLRGVDKADIGITVSGYPTSERLL